MSAEAVHVHPLLACAHAAREALSKAAGYEPSFLSVRDKKTLSRELVALEAQVAELRARVLAESGDVGEAVGARDASTWLASVAKVDRRQARADLELGRSLDRYRLVADGMRAGVVNTAQARVITHALDELPADLDAAIKDNAEAHLVELAADFDPGQLRTLGRHILHVVAPDLADTEDAKALEREEQRAHDKCVLRLRPLGDGTTRISGLLPDADAARLGTYLDALTSPRLHTGEPIPRSKAMGQAFCTLLEHLDPTKLPDHGGDATTIIVTIDETRLRSDLATAGLMGSADGNVQITATQARRLACTAKILPTVLGGKGEILDLGRTRRLFSSAQRKALRIRDRHCRAEGCTIPAAWTEAHHVNPWSRGGKTDLADGVLLCSHHHHRAHDQRYDHDVLPSGDWRFHLRR